MRGRPSERINLAQERLAEWFSHSQDPQRSSRRLQPIGPMRANVGRREAPSVASREFRYRYAPALHTVPGNPGGALWVTAHRAWISAASRFIFAVARPALIACSGAILTVNGGTVIL